MTRALPKVVPPERKSTPVTARFCLDGITISDLNTAGEGVAKVFQRIYRKPI